MEDWSEWEKRLRVAGEDIDDAVDELVSEVLSDPPDPAAAPALILALDPARSDLSLADAATALAWAAGGDPVPLPEADMTIKLSSRLRTFFTKCP